MPKLITTLLLAIAGFCFGSLLSGASYLDQPLPGGLPIGNALTAIGLCAVSMTAFWLSPLHSARRRLSILAMLASIVWLPLSIALAGNLALNFSNGRGTVWLAVSSTTAIVALGSLTWAGAGSLWALRSTRKPPQSTDSASGP
jgi:hypothetical protein